MRSRRAFTMIELTITVSLTALVVGVIATMYSFVSIRLCDSYAQSMVTDQINDVADRIEATIRNADTCKVLDSGATLVCGMPAKGVDSNGDGHYDTYYPDSVDANGNGIYTIGRYYWFFQRGPDGNYATPSSGYIWRADSTSATSPATTDNDAAFMYYPGTVKRLRNRLVYAAVFSVNASTNSVTFKLTAGSRIGSENTDTSDINASRIVTVTRTVQWRE